MNIFKLLFLFSFIKLNDGLPIYKCFQCRFLKKNYNNFYQSECTYYSYINETYKVRQKTDFISVQEALHNSDLCGMERKKFQQIIN